MKSSKSSQTLKSFGGLKVLLKNGNLPLHQPAPVAQVIPHRRETDDSENEQRLFQEAMAYVTPIARDRWTEKLARVKVPDGPQKNSDTGILKELSNLITHGEGFVVAHTPEYIEGTGYGVHPEIAERLHRGDFAIQAHVDLHGLNARDAWEIFDQFLKEMVLTGKRAVLIVHGRGLSSPEQPVIKAKVVEWLTRSLWRKWVAAFSSARSCDGGAGATYVLLRQRPLTKRFKKRQKAKRRVPSPLIS